MYIHEKEKFYKDDIPSRYFLFNKELIFIEQEVWTTLPNSGIWFYINV